MADDSPVRYEPVRSTMSTPDAFDIVLALAGRAERQAQAREGSDPVALAKVDLAMSIVTGFARSYFVDKIKTPRRD